MLILRYLWRHNTAPFQNCFLMSSWNLLWGFFQDPGWDPCHRAQPSPFWQEILTAVIRLLKCNSSLILKADLVTLKADLVTLKADLVTFCFTATSDPIHFCFPTFVTCSIVLALYSTRSFLWLTIHPLPSLIMDSPRQSTGPVCPLCSQTFESTACVRSHVVVDNKTGWNSCDLCQWASRSRSALSRHLTMHTGDQYLNCVRCNYITVGKRSLMRHYKGIHNGE